MHISRPRHARQPDPLTTCCLRRLSRRPATHLPPLLPPLAALAGSIAYALTADVDEARPEAAEVLPAGATAAQAASSIIEDGGPTPEKGSGWRMSVHERRVPAR